MAIRRIFLACCTAISLSACADASLDELVEQLSTPGNVQDLSKNCTFPAGTQFNPEIQSAYLFEYGDHHILRLSNAGLSCGEALVQPTDVDLGCPIPRSTWQADIGIPKSTPYLNAPVSCESLPATFHGLMPGHNYCTGNTFNRFAAASTLEIKSVAPNCIMGEFKNPPSVGFNGNEQSKALVSLSGPFPIQVCTAKKPEIGMSFDFELSKSSAAQKASLPQ